MKSSEFFAQSLFRKIWFYSVLSNVRLFFEMKKKKKKKKKEKKIFNPKIFN
jgi:hypothetical protein